MESITEAAQYELAPFGIRVKLVEPGGEITEFVNSLYVLMTPGNDAHSPFIQKVMAGFGQGQETYSSAENIAGVIYTAPTDEGPRLRYAAGDDAVALVAARSRAPDEVIFKNDMYRFEWRLTKR